VVEVPVVDGVVEVIESTLASVPSKCPPGLSTEIGI